MKIRTNFVSNSSSTSFTVKYDTKDFEKCEHCGHKPLTPLELARLEDGQYSSGDETKIIFETLQGCIDDLQDELLYSMEDTDYANNIREQIKKYEKMQLGPTEEILGVSASYDSRTESELERMLDSGLVENLDLFVDEL